jgi:hypothetical protein
MERVFFASASPSSDSRKITAIITDETSPEQARAQAEQKAAELHLVLISPFDGDSFVKAVHADMYVSSLATIATGEFNPPAPASKSVPESGMPSNFVEIFKDAGKQQPAPIAPSDGALETLVGSRYEDK